MERRLPARSSGASSVAGSWSRAKLAHVDRELAERHYAEHAEKPFFAELVGFITTGSTLALVLEGEDAVRVTRSTIGATNPVDAAPGTIRGDLALAMPNNLVHGSDSPETAAREIALWFGDDSTDYPEYVAQNVAIWTKSNAEYTGPQAREAWAKEDDDAGALRDPRVRVDALGDVSGLDVVELGCGTAYLSAWLAKRGARPVGVDPTPAQLETAREMQKEFGLEFPLVEAVGEDVPLPDASFDLAVSEYGASIWADPYRWIPEAARLLRPGGRLVFLRNSTLSMLSCTSRTTRPSACSGRSGAEPDRVAGHGRGRVSPSGRRTDRRAPRQRLRDRAADRALRAGGRGDARVLRLRHRGLGEEVAGGGDLGHT